MYAQMFHGSRLLILPLTALVFFFSIFVGVIVLYLRKSKTTLDALAALPLQDDASDAGEQS